MLKYEVPYRKWATNMALNVQMILSENKLIGEKIVTPRLVNQQTLDYDTFCDYLAQGSTVTAADVSAVMKQLEKNIPLILGLNTRIIASPEGLVFRPSVRGSITQSQLKAKLTQRRQDYIDAGDLEAADKVNPDRALEASDLATSDLQACIVIDLPRKWDTRFQQSVNYKRITKASVSSTDNTDADGDNTGGGGGNTGGGNTGGGNTDNTGTDNTGQGTLYTLNISSANASQGSVDTSVNKQYSAGSRVTIKATPASGFAFDRWSDGSTVNPRNITLNQDVTLTAAFKTATVTPPGEDDDDSPFDGGM